VMFQRRTAHDVGTIDRLRPGIMREPTRASECPEKLCRGRRRHDPDYAAAMRVLIIVRRKFTI
jgi:hypothetical protein